MKVTEYKVSGILEYLLDHCKEKNLAYTIIHTYDLKNIYKFVKRAERKLLKNG
jgi:hypothetical protein